MEEKIVGRFAFESLSIEKALALPVEHAEKVSIVFSLLKDAVEAFRKDPDLDIMGWEKSWEKSWEKFYSRFEEFGMK